MATNGIGLTANMTSNLLALQNTQKLMDVTQERLATGLKVNSAIDNPSAYYTAQSLNQRAGDLTSLLDGMGQGIQTIKAANEGIEAITKFVEQAKSVANQALETSDGAQRDKLLGQFNEIRNQINSMAKDSGYKGKNLLGGTSEKLTVFFNEDRGSKVEVTGVDGSTTGLGIAEAAGWKAADATEAAITAATKAINDSIEDVEAAINTLRGWASDFGNNFSILQNREDFTSNLVNVLTEGADKLTLADMNEESANMLALQTRQQLGVNSLSLASQANQSVLRLF